MSAEGGSTWNCYNIFGYRLYNYIFTSYTDFLGNFISKMRLTFGNYEKETEDKAKNKVLHILSRIIFYTSLSFSIVTFFFVGGLLLPYLLTNVIPMTIVYINIVVIYIFVVALIMFLILCLEFFIAIITYERESTAGSLILRILRYARLFTFTYGLRLFPNILSILFNLSQYLYYGEDYYQALTDEYISRDPTTFIQNLQNQTSQVAHTILDTI
jgi:hypothetical protein